MDETTRDQQQALPFGPLLPGDLPPGALPFDDEADRPIGFSLTARARRRVAPDELPQLRVVDGGGIGAVARPTGIGGVLRPPASDDADLDHPDDTRPSRARALRRAGVGVAAIARQLSADELVVRAWVGDVSVHPTAARRDRGGSVAPAVAAADVRRRQGLEGIRSAAVMEGRERLQADPAFAAGLGLLVALASPDEHAVTVVTSAREVAATLQSWLVATTGVGGEGVRVVLRLGPDVAGDLARSRWADALQVPPERIVHTRWRGAPAPDAEEALIRVPDPELAARIAGWRQALLRPEPVRPADGGF